MKSVDFQMNKGNIIFEQTSNNRRGFMFFLANVNERGENYRSTLIFFGICILGVTLSYLTLKLTLQDIVNLILIVSSLISIFVSVQLADWTKCFFIDGEELYFGYYVFNRCYFPVSRKISNLKSISKDTRYMVYRIIFNYGLIKYTICYSLQDNRLKDLEKLGMLSSVVKSKISDLIN